MLSTRPRLTLALVFVLGVVAGAVPAAVLAFRSGRNVVLDNWVNTNARNSIEVAQALRHFRTGATGSGMENLETHLNRLVVGLAPSYVEGIKLSDATLSGLRTARDSARSYRTAYPRPASEKLLDREVAEFLASADSVRR